MSESAGMEYSQHDPAVRGGGAAERNGFVYNFEAFKDKIFSMASISVFLMVSV